MATLISWTTNEGEKGRCDARCHNAKGENCKCCCCGHYHGAGRDGVLIQKSQDMLNEIIERLVEEGKEVKA